MVVHDKNLDKSTKEVEGKLSQIQDQLQKLMDEMLNMNDRNARTDKELMEIKQVLGNWNQKGRDVHEGRVESSVDGDEPRGQGYPNTTENFKILVVNSLLVVLSLNFLDSLVMICEPSCIKWISFFLWMRFHLIKWLG